MLSKTIPLLDIRLGILEVKNLGINFDFGKYIMIHYNKQIFLLITLQIYSSKANAISLPLARKLHSFKFAYLSYLFFFYVF